MTLFNFTLTIEGADILTDEALDALYEAGCGDATFGVSGGVQTASSTARPRTSPKPWPVRSRPWKLPSLEPSSLTSIASLKLRLLVEDVAPCCPCDRSG